MRCAKSAISSVLTAALASCGVLRSSDAPLVCPSYETSIRPLLESRCVECHSASRAEGGYQLGEYTQTVSRGDDGTARVAPGVRPSPFLAAARGELAPHVALPDAEVTRLQDWVERCRAAPSPHQFHPPGWATPTDTEQSHSVALRQNFYNLNECKTCHGDDLRGGGSQVDCNSCHLEGPLACNTCHGDEHSSAPPRDLKGLRTTQSLGVGAHRAHVTASPTHQAYGCKSCHLDVQSATDEGHYRRAGVFLSGPAEVILASGSIGSAQWDRTTATCSNTACHAPSSTDTAATQKAPVWTRVGQGEATCGSCHGVPPSSHADNRCELCHGPGYIDGGVNLELHLNGHVDLRNGGQRCDACHADSTSTRFVDLLGRSTDAGVRTVGAHDAHLFANRLRGPMTCNECHLVPATVTALGHLDSSGPAEVFVRDTGHLAWKQGALPTYNASNATCTNYCHGAGEYGHPDVAPSLMKTPSWTGGTSQAACGTCHGLPPQDGTPAHLAAATIACAVCHSGTVAPDGGILFSTAPDGTVSSRHLDGLVTP